MNKFIRNTLIVFAIMFGIGLVCLISGGVLGGFEQVIKLGNSGKLSWTLDPTHFDNFGYLDYSGQVRHYPVIDDEYLIDDYENAVDKSEISEICVRMAAGSLTVDHSNDDMVHISETNIPSLHCYLEDDILYIYADKKPGECSDGRKLNIELPKDIILTNYDVSMGAGESYIKQINAEEIDIELGAGNMVIDHVETDYFNGRVGAGSLSIEDGKVGEMQCDIGMGNFYYEGSVTDDTSVKCAMGRADIRLTEAEEYFNYHLSAAMGNVSIGKQDFGGLASDRVIYHDADRDFRVECAMGGINIAFID